MVKADAVKLEQVFDNLILNAVETMNKKGRLTIYGGYAADTACIVFENTGPGIEDKIKDKIFEPLFTTKPYGTGFGLAMARKLIAAHGGTISVENKKGRFVL